MRYYAKPCKTGWFGSRVRGGDGEWTQIADAIAPPDRRAGLGLARARHGIQTLLSSAACNPGRLAVRS